MGASTGESGGGPFGFVPQQGTPAGIEHDARQMLDRFEKRLNYIQRRRFKKRKNELVKSMLAELAAESAQDMAARARAEAARLVHQLKDEILGEHPEH